MLCHSLLPVAGRLSEHTRSYFKRQLESPFTFSLLPLKLYSHALVCFLHCQQGVNQRRLVKKAGNENIIYYNGVPFHDAFPKSCLVSKASLWGFFYDCGHEIKNIMVVYPMSHRLKYISEQILISSPVNRQQNTASSQPTLGNQTSLQPNTHQLTKAGSDDSNTFLCLFLRQATES